MFLQIYGLFCKTFCNLCYNQLIDLAQYHKLSDPVMKINKLGIIQAKRDIIYYN